MRDRVDALDWEGLAAEVDASGSAQTAPVLTPDECREIAALYDDAGRFRSTIDMARYRFGSGQYRYLDHPLPDVVTELRAAFYPHLLPIARRWAERLDRPAPWPDTLEEWLDMCHTAGPAKPTPSRIWRTRVKSTLPPSPTAGKYQSSNPPRLSFRWTLRTRCLTFSSSSAGSTARL